MKRRKTAKRRASKGLSAPATRRKRRSGLSEGLSMTKLKDYALNSSLGALGGAGATIGTKITNTITKGSVIGNLLASFTVGLVISAIGAPKIGIGYAGGSTALALAGGLKDDNTEIAEDEPLEEGEIYQTESGDYVKMLSDGTLEYLSEEEVNALQDGEIYPEYSTMNSFQS